MRRRAVRLLCAMLIPAAALLVPTGGVAGAQQQIGPDQHFIGLVNGSHDRPTVYTVCPGPERSGRRGPVAGGQTLMVAEVAASHGYTGPLTQVFAWFTPVGRKAPTTLTFTTYGTPQTIPPSMRVPCDGKGRVVFSPCPYLAPCVAGWTPDVVRVTFVDIAV